MITKQDADSIAQTMQDAYNTVGKELVHRRIVRQKGVVKPGKTQHPEKECSPSNIHFTVACRSIARVYNANKKRLDAAISGPLDPEFLPEHTQKNIIMQALPAWLIWWLGRILLEWMVDAFLNIHNDKQGV